MTQLQLDPAGRTELAKTFLITGVSSGLGRAFAEAALAVGHVVVGTVRKEDARRQFETLAPERAYGVVLDVTDFEQTGPVVARVEQEVGPIDVLVNNAGYGFISGLEEAAEAEYRDQFEVNFFGTVAMTKAVLPMMRRRQSGFIVNISSIVGAFGVSGVSFYSASKFALEGLSESLVEELKPFGIGVLIVEPGPFRTEFFGGSVKTPATPMADYPHTASMRASSAKVDGKQPGDPQRAAKAILDTVMGDNSPTRIVLGANAFDRVHAALKRRITDIERTHEQAKTTDFPVN